MNACVDNLLGNDQQDDVCVFTPDKAHVQDQRGLKAEVVCMQSEHQMLSSARAPTNTKFRAAGT